MALILVGCFLTMGCFETPDRYEDTDTTINFTFDNRLLSFMVSFSDEIEAGDVVVVFTNDAEGVEEEFTFANEGLVWTDPGIALSVRYSVELPSPEDTYLVAVHLDGDRKAERTFDILNHPQPFSEYMANMTFDDVVDLPGEYRSMYWNLSGWNSKRMVIPDVFEQRVLSGEWRIMETGWLGTYWWNLTGTKHFSGHYTFSGLVEKERDLTRSGSLYISGDDGTYDLVVADVHEHRTVDEELGTYIDGFWMNATGTFTDTGGNTSQVSMTVSGVGTEWYESHLGERLVIRLDENWEFTGARTETIHFQRVDWALRDVFNKTFEIVHFAPNGTVDRSEDVTMEREVRGIDITDFSTCNWPAIPRTFYPGDEFIFSYLYDPLTGTEVVVNMTVLRVEDHSYGDLTMPTSVVRTNDITNVEDGSSMTVEIIGSGEFVGFLSADHFSIGYQGGTRQTDLELVSIELL